MQQAPFVEIYEALIKGINALGVDTFSAAQDVPKKLPVCRVQLLSGADTNEFSNAREYAYPFQIDVVTAQNGLAQGLQLAYQVMDLCRKISVPDYALQFADTGKPSLSSMVDTSTNRVLNRQIIRVSYQTIEATAF